MNEAPPFTANTLLQSLEASARRAYEDAFARGRFDVLEAAAHVDLASSERIIVGYNCLGQTTYWYREAVFEQMVEIVNRAVCLLMLGQRMGEGVAS